MLIFLSVKQAICAFFISSFMLSSCMSRFLIFLMIVYARILLVSMRLSIISNAVSSVSCHQYCSV